MVSGETSAILGVNVNAKKKLYNIKLANELEIKRGKLE